VRSLFLPSVALFLIFACGGEKIDLPQQPDLDPTTPAVDDTTYLQLSPVWDNASGYDFNQPTDILVGREPLIYVADTGNDRIVMMDIAGNVIGMSKPIANPVAIAQDSKLNLLIVSDSNRIFRIDLIAANHDLSSAAVDTVFHEADNPSRRFTGIAPVLSSSLGRTKIDYYVSATGNRRQDNQILIFPEAFNVRVPNAANLESGGLGILSVSNASGITTLRDFNVDFIFCMVGQNSFKVQWITAGEFGYEARLNPAQGSFDLFEPGKFEAPEDVAVDEEGNIFVVDATNDFLYKFSAIGDELQSFGSSGSGEKEFRQPHGVAAFNKTLYVADTGNNRIVRFKLSTDVSRN
jgi:hypothetical protein